MLRNPRTNLESFLKWWMCECSIVILQMTFLSNIIGNVRNQTVETLICGLLSIILFLSIVENRNNSSELLVRARVTDIERGFLQLKLLRIQMLIIDTGL